MFVAGRFCKVTILLWLHESVFSLYRIDMQKGAVNSTYVYGHALILNGLILATTVSHAFHSNLCQLLKSEVSDPSSGCFFWSGLKRPKCWL